MKSFLTRLLKAVFSEHLRITTSVIYLLGVVWRWFFITKWHDPRKYVYSDMQMYVGLAKRLLQPGYKVQIGDITHPPGNTWILMYFMKRDESMLQLVYFNFVTCALVPLAMGLLGWVTFGKKTGLWAVIVASVYFHYVDFGGYFLAEIHLTLAGTLCIAAYFYAMKLAERAPSARRTVLMIGAAVVGGFLFSWCMTLKMVAMPVIVGFVTVHFLFTKGPPRMIRAMVLAAFMVAAIPLTGVMVNRCTTANEGRFCTGSNKSAADFLLGHYGRIQGVEWRDPKSRGVVGFGNPSAYQHGYRDKEVVPFAITDQAKNNAYAWKWVRKNPGQALVLSFEHVWDSFGGAYPWPPAATGTWPASSAACYVFLFFFFFPSIVLLADVMRKRGVLGLLRSLEFAVLSPIFGVCLAVFVATGEVRYRMPWDGAFIVLGIEFYRRMTLRFFEPAVPDTLATVPYDGDVVPAAAAVVVTEAVVVEKVVEKAPPIPRVDEEDAKAEGGKAGGKTEDGVSGPADDKLADEKADDA